MRVPVPVKASIVNTTTALPVPLALPEEMCRNEALELAVQAFSVDKITEELLAALPTKIALVPRAGWITWKVSSTAAAAA